MAGLVTDAMAQLLRLNMERREKLGRPSLSLTRIFLERVIVKGRFQARDSNRVFPRYEAGVPRIAPNYPGIPRKVAGSIPPSVIGIFHSHKSLPIALWPWGRLSL